MMNYIWAGMIIISFAFSFFSGNSAALGEALMNGANQAVELILSILGTLCFWSGIMEISSKSGLSEKISKALSPVLSRLFSDVPRESEAMKYITLNISANLLGLSNAATPFGLRAVRELQNMNAEKDRASDSMVLFVVLNTASLQIIPTTLGAYRSNYGSKAPFDILPAVWLTSLLALFFGVSSASAISSMHRELPKYKKRRGSVLRNLQHP